MFWWFHLSQASIDLLVVFEALEQDEYVSFSFSHPIKLKENLIWQAAKNRTLVRKRSRSVLFIVLNVISDLSLDIKQVEVKQEDDDGSERARDREKRVSSLQRKKRQQGTYINMAI